ncbi:MAG TPA: ABC transporter ATP-binding protein, partial [archaeon]|nr:ABC transporter ATP-binding protein [archaeon]
MLEVMDLDFNYNGAQILKHINLVANKGEFIGIIGPNGSGKTTLLRTITNILKPRAGTIWINENHINGMRSKDIAKNVGMVSQG